MTATQRRARYLVTAALFLAAVLYVAAVLVSAATR